jgi:hypothetical protein
VNSSPPKPEVILTKFFAEPTVLLVPIISRDNMYIFVYRFEDMEIAGNTQLVIGV